MSEIKVHHLDNSRSQRILWLLEELGVDYEVELYKRDPKTMRAPKSLEAIHPLGKSPVVEIDGGVILAESGAIIEELLDRYGEGRLRPEPGTEAHRRYRFWLHYAEGSFMPPQLVKLVIHRVRSAPLPFLVKPVGRAIANKVDEGYTDPEITKHLAFVETELGKNEWLAGNELSGADVQMSYPLEASLARSGIKQGYPRIAAWLDAIHAREAYRRALERGGPLDILGS